MERHDFAVLGPLSPRHQTPLSIILGHSTQCNSDTRSVCLKSQSSSEHRPATFSSSVTWPRKPSFSERSLAAADLHFRLHGSGLVVGVRYILDAAGR